MKRIGLLSFGHWNARGRRVRSAADSLLQSIELAVAAEEIGVDGAFFRVHHFERQLSAPWPLLAAIAARTSRIELGTGVTDMRYEHPLDAAEEAAAVDLISGGRLQLGISRGSPESALHGSRAFGHVPAGDETDADLARAKTERFLRAIDGEGVVEADPAVTGIRGRLAVQPQSPGLRERVWWGAGSRATAAWAAERGMNLMSSTLLLEDTGVPFDVLQAQQIRAYREAFADAGWQRAPRVSVARTVVPIVDDEDLMRFGDPADGADAADQVGVLDGVRSRGGRTYQGSPGRVARLLAADEAVQEADTVLFTVPSQLGVDASVKLLRAIADHVAPAIGWTPTTL